jgi:YggT family protein
MSNSYLSTPIEFVINTLFGLYVMALMLRFLLAWVRADFYNPISQFLVKITNPLLAPLRRVVPSVGGIDLASILLMLLIQMAALAIILAVRGNGIAPATLLFWSLAELLTLLFNIFIFSILIQVILSWVGPGTYNPLSALLYSLNEPLLRPLRQILPPISGIDLSPLLALFGLQLIKMLSIPLLTGLAFNV